MAYLAGSGTDLPANGHRHSLQRGLCEGLYQRGPVTAADLPNDGVITFFEDRGIPALSIMTDRGTEFCGALDRHPYELYLQLNDIEHTKTRARNPQTNG